MALRKLTECRIACANTYHELCTLDELTDDWNMTADEVLESAALDIHLSCENGAKEAHTILDILTGFLTNGEAPDWLWMEAEVRQELASTAAKEILRVVDGLALVNASPELGLKEMRRRAEMIKMRIDGLKTMVDQLRAELLIEGEKQQQAEAARKDTP